MPRWMHNGDNFTCQRPGKSNGLVRNSFLHPADLPGSRVKLIAPAVPLRHISF
jgi:hypothetical protein